MDLADTGGLSARTHRPRSRFRVPERRPVAQCLWREDERTRYVPPHRSAQSTDRRLWWYHLTRLRRGPAFLFATAGTTNCCDQTVGLVPPSLTNSVPVIVEGVHCFVPVRNSSLFKFLYARKTVFHHSLPEIPGSARDGKPRSFLLCFGW
jgi:hypothetical protein